MWTDLHVEADGRLSQFCERHPSVFVIIRGDKMCLLQVRGGSYMGRKSKNKAQEVCEPQALH